ncbi:hypothetical protein Ahy_A07g035985 [Arachis hypogaea]|uniref:Uncharacterized protein n=1 Tax=Arachis hypogaea TaxID=3818 RepID=A0A445CEY7_ARAHY|nr:hypothetical protein Ahy_A07g035985 [Arachis hypogaea]
MVTVMMKLPVAIPISDVGFQQRRWRGTQLHLLFSIAFLSLPPLIFARALPLSSGSMAKTRGGGDEDGSMRSSSCSCHWLASLSPLPLDSDGAVALSSVGAAPPPPLFFLLHLPSFVFPCLVCVCVAVMAKSIQAFREEKKMSARHYPRRRNTPPPLPQLAASVRNLPPPHATCHCRARRFSPHNEDILGEHADIFIEHYYIKQSGNCDLSSMSNPHNEFKGKNLLIE